MRQRRAGLLWAVSIGTILTSPATVAGPNQDGPRIEWSPFIGAAFDGSPLEGELGRICAPEDRSKPDGPMIEIAFVRYRTTTPNPGPPIFFLAGGPGASGTEFGGPFVTHPQIRLLEHSDVIAVDQRGTGLSQPNLMTPEFTEQLPLDRAIDRADVVRAMGSAVTGCVNYWSERGVELGAYNSVESADDIDDVRRALGHDQIVTVGTSYGSHLALAYLRRHGEHVARAALLKVEGPGHTWKLPSTVQLQLERLHEQVIADPELRAALPDFLGVVRNLLAQLHSQPVSATLHDGSTDPLVIRLGPYDLQCAIARALATSSDLAKLPAALARCARGDWTWLAESAAEQRRVSIQAMPLMMDCASGGTAQRLARIEQERQDGSNLLGDALMAPLYPISCAECGSPDLGDAFRGPFACDVPTLFVSGTLDARTPPSNVEEIRSWFSDHAHIVVQNTGHDGRELMSEEYRDILQAFVRGEKIQSSVITLPAVMLEAIE